jgi:hypothetical protein
MLSTQYVESINTSLLTHSCPLLLKLSSNCACTQAAMPPQLLPDKQRKAFNILWTREAVLLLLLLGAA